MSEVLVLPHGRLDPARRLRIPVGPFDRVRGAGPLALVIYSDFECGDCQVFHRAFTQVSEEVRERVRVVHRHFPLVSSHPRAMQAALAVEAAHEQGAFWAMYDYLLTAERDRAPGEIDRIAEQLGLDLPRFRRDVIDRVHADRVWMHVRGGRESGVTGTPGLFLQGTAYTPPLGSGQLEEDLRAALASFHVDPATPPSS